MTEELFEALQRIKYAMPRSVSPADWLLVEKQLTVRPLTAHDIGRAWRGCGALSATPPDWAIQFAQNIRKVLAE